MQDSNQSSLKKAIFKIRMDDVSVIKANLRRLQERNPEIKYDSIRIGHLGDDTLLSFNITADHFSIVVEKLESIGAISMMKENNTTATQQPRQARERSFIPPPAKTKTQEKKDKDDNPVNVLNNSIDEGDFEKVIQISKNVKLGFEIVKQAKESLNKSIENGIKKSFNKALLNKSYLTESISDLLKICSSNTLRTLNKVDLMTEAGLKAIELCTKDEDFYTDLIKIANNNLVPSMVVIKAAAKFSELVFYDEIKFQEDLLYAVKYLNTRWVLIAADVVVAKLTVAEKLLLKNLLTYIEKNR